MGAAQRAAADATPKDPRLRKLGTWFDLKKVIFLITGVITVFLVMMPLTILIIGSFSSGNPGQPGTEFTLSNYAQILTNAKIRAGIWNSLVISVLSTGGAVGLGVLLAWTVTRTDTPARRWLRPLIIIPFFLSPFVTSIAWRFLLAPSGGILNDWARHVFGLDAALFDIYTIGGIVWVSILTYVPYAFIFTSSVLVSVDPAYEESSRVTGASIWATARRITIPLVSPAVLSSIVIIFILNLGQFGIPYALGNAKRIPVLSTLIYSSAAIYPPTFTLGAALGCTMVVVVATLLWFQRRMERNASFATVGGKGYRSDISPIGKWRFATFLLACAYVLVAVVLPYLALIVVALERYYATDLSWDLLTLENFRYVLFDLGTTVPAIINTVIFGAIAASCIAVLGLIVAFIQHRTAIKFRNLLSFIATMPLALPGIVLALGLLWAWVLFPIGVYGTGAILIIGFVTRDMPFGVRMMSASLQQIHGELWESAQSAGASWLQTMRWILLPLLKPGLMAVWATVFVMAVRELNVAVLLYSSGNEVLSVLLYELLGEGSAPYVAVTGILQTVLIGIVLLLAYRTLRTGTVRV